MVYAVTGAGGYVGSRVAASLRVTGAEVRELTRASGFRLEGSVPDLSGIDGLVHCAWDFSARSAGEIQRVNVEGSRRLLHAASEAGVERIVFVSTLSAFPGCRSLYGRAKLAVEATVRSLGGQVIRPGLVWGPEPAGLYGALTRIAQLRVLPMIGGSKRLHLSHEDDVAALVGALLAGERLEQPVVAADLEPLSLEEILGRIAGRRPLLIPIPWRLAWLGVRTLELAGLRPAFRSDSVVSLVSLDETPLESGAIASPVPFRRFAP